MIQKLQEPVSVWLIFDHVRRVTVPKRVLWQKRVYEVEMIGLHHQFRVGRVLYHIFSVVAGGLFFRLSLNTENLQWVLEEIADGEPG
jgi:hypothetical protein